jgi:hypothetical protein
MVLHSFLTTTQMMVSDASVSIFYISNYTCIFCFLGNPQEAWWEDPKFLKSVEEASGSKPKTVIEEEIEVVKDERTLEIEKIANEWAKREFFRQSMAGTVDEDMTEEAFIESVWDRALFEGDLKYRQLKGEVLDEEAELLDFKARQERKQQAMLKKAKEELKEILDEEDLAGDDLKDLDDE